MIGCNIDFYAIFLIKKTTCGPKSEKWPLLKTALKMLYINTPTDLIELCLPEVRAENRKKCEILPHALNGEKVGPAGGQI